MAESNEKIIEALRASMMDAERLRQRNKELVDGLHEPIAIVGMACRYPGGARTPEDLWQLIRGGKDAVGGFPHNRGWDLDDVAGEGTSTREGGFLADADRFDPAFFGISPRETLDMDPQHRLLLETSWEALERAGLRPATLQGSQTGVFVGVMYNNHSRRGVAASVASEGYVSLASSGSMASGRIAYAFDFRGPTVTLDTACSSSLVALHLACQGLRQGECSLALAGGVTVMATQAAFDALAGIGAGAPDGRCKSFSEKANGAGWSEGAGMLLLERLSVAQQLGHPVLAVIRGSAINQDGKSQGITAPNGPAQERVIRQALENARLAASDVDVVEGHGTGTILGDPIEVQALFATYGEAHSKERPLWLGSLKSNLGHTQGAAGVGGIIKMVLALQHGILPKTLHASEPSSHVDWSSGTVRLLDEAAPWKPNGHPRRAAVSAFGFSGTNAHVIIEEALAKEPAVREASRPSLSALPIVLSAKSDASLQAQADRLGGHLAAAPELELADIAHTLATARSHFDHRAAFVARDLGELKAALAVLARGDSASSTVRGRGRREGQLALLFTGQGSQRASMGRALYDAFPRFRAAFEELCVELDRGLERPLCEVLFAEEGSRDAALLDQTAFTQTALFALEVALYRLFESYGLVPDFLLGHSIGELVAAHVAGVLTLKDACSLVCARGRLMQALPSRGIAVAVQASETEVLAALAGRDGRACIAGLNGPSASVLSGDEDAVTEIARHFAALGRKTSRVRVSHAVHSHHMDGMLEAFAKVARGLKFHPPRIAIVSNVTGLIASAEEICSPEYWVRHVRGTVRFVDGVRTLRAHGVSTFLELGPHAVLSALGQEILAEDRDTTFVPTLRKGRSDVEGVLASLGALHAGGTAIDWGVFFEPFQARTVQLPTYAFQPDRYWVERSETGRTDVTAAGLSSPDHPFLGAAVTLAATDGFAFTGRLTLSEHPWLAAHTIFGVTLLPGSAFVELALGAAQRVGLERVEELELETPLVVPAKGAILIQLAVGALDDSGRRSLGIFSRLQDASADTPWTKNASGWLTPPMDSVGSDLRVWPPPGATSLAIDGLYERLATTGIGYGPSFQGLRAAWSRGNEVFAEVRLGEAIASEAGRFAIHPALLDSALHALMLDDNRTSADAASDGSEGDRVFVPVAWSGVALHAVGASALRVRFERREHGVLAVTLADAAGALVASVESLLVRPVAAEQLRSARASDHEALFGVDWSRLASPAHPKRERWALLGEDKPALTSVLRSGVVNFEHFSTVEDLRRALSDEVSLPDVVVVPCFADDCVGTDLVSSVQRVTSDVLSLLQAWFADERLVGSRLVLLTQRAVATRMHEDVLDLAAAGIWGLVRSAQAENPDYAVSIVDIDASDASRRAMLETLGAEPQLALRDGQALVPSLVRLSTHEPVEAAPPQLSSGTVLITGGTGALGALVARHLVRAHGVRHLLLVSRRGQAADGAEALQRELSEDASVTVASCDVSSRDALQRLLESIPSERPLTAVFHCAGVTDDGVFASLTPERLRPVFGAKVDAALHLHELTQELPLAAFVLFSSLAGVLGGQGQANYAAANACLDALAHHRRARGLNAVALDWGYWDLSSSLTAHLSDVDRRRMARAGLRPLTSRDGLGLLDVALARQEAELVCAPFELAALRAQAQAQAIHPMLYRLVDVRRKPPSAANTASAASIKSKILALPNEAREPALLELVCLEIAAVLGMASPSTLDPARPLQELGLDSLMAVELRNRIGVRTGLRLQATLLFNHPTASALARHLMTLFVGRDAEPVRLPAAATVTDEPIAIVGMSCRYPGGVRTPEDLWQLLSAGTDAISSFPENRGWDVDSLYDPNPEAKGKSYTRDGGFLLDADWFEPTFFGISPREAVGIDPQQRLLLETAWEAIERAGLDPIALQGSPTGVFVGVMYNDYAQVLYAAESHDHTGMGSAPSVASGRIAYTLGLEGPAVTLDTACSSSLVALHLGAQALRQGDCSLALAGGVTLMATPASFVAFSQQRGLAPDGRCKAFAAEADGTAWAEGAGMLLLERLSDAKRNGHPVLAVLRGSAVNQDGKSQGLTAPNGPAQERLIRQALAAAGLNAQEVDAVEAHGTGTRLGDPIEAQALFATYGEARSKERPLWLGSIKSNLGHTQAAAGVGGVIKMILAMQHGMLPRTLHSENPSPHIDWSSGTIRLLHEPVPWKPNGHPRRGAVSSFGVSGTNAHVILEEAPNTNGLGEESIEQNTPLPVVLSARSASALKAMIENLREHLVAHPEQKLGDVALRLSSRSAMPHRFAAVASSREGLVATLQAAAGGQTVPGMTRGRALSSPGKLAFVFTGQGAQCLGMGLELYRDWPVFRSAFDTCAALFDKALSRPLREVIWAAPGSADAERLDETAYTQPALFTFEYALAELWRSWAVEPALVAGHSIGELVAACVAGVFSLEDAVCLVTARARLMQALPTGGAMVYMGASEQEVGHALQPHAAEVSIAAVNGPRQVVISGDATLVHRVAEGFAARGVQTKQLRVSHAFHSVLMEPMLEDFRRVAQSVTYRVPAIPVVSNVTGAAETTLLMGADYWVEHVRRAVRFGDGVQALHAAGTSTFLELGPKGTLAGLIVESLPEGNEALVLRSLRTGSGETASVLEGLASIWVSGRAVRWPHAGTLSANYVPLPTYPWQKQRFSPGLPKVGRARRSGGHPVLGTAIALSMPVGTWLWEAPLTHAESRFSASTSASEVLSVAELIDMSLCAASEVHGIGRFSIHAFALAVPVGFGSEESKTLQLVVSPKEPGLQRIDVCTRPDSRSPWTQHVSAELRSAQDLTVAGAREDLSAIRARCASGVAAERREALGILPVAPPGSDALADLPAILDACFASIAAALPENSSENVAITPIAVEQIRLFARPAGVAWSHVRLRGGGDEGTRSVTADIQLLDESGARLLELSGVEVRLDQRASDRRRQESVSGPPVLDTLRRALPSERQRLIEHYLTMVFSNVLRLEAALIERDAPLANMGIDSLMALNVRGRLEAELGVKLPVDFVWKCQDVSALARLVSGEWLFREATWSVDESQTAAQVAEVDYVQETL